MYLQDLVTIVQENDLVVKLASIYHFISLTCKYEQNLKESKKLVNVTIFTHAVRSLLTHK